MEAMATQLYVDFSTAAAFLSPEILSIDSEKLDKWMAEDDMAVYRHQIEDICRSRAHTLSKSEETMLAMLGDAAETPHKAFDMFDSVDVRFPNLDNGEKLTHALFGKYRESADRAVRHDAFEKYFGEYNKYINTISALYSGSVKLDCYGARVRKLSQRAGGGALCRTMYPNRCMTTSISCAARRHYDAAAAIWSCAAKSWGLKSCSLYDLYVPLVSRC